MHRQNLCLIRFLILIMALLDSCQAQPTIVTSPPTQAASMTPKPTASPTRPSTETATHLPSSTSTMTLTPTTSPTRTRTPTNTPTWTPLPTLPASEAQALVLELLKTNGGCKLPCWWGMTPGKTEWLPSKAFLDRFATYIYSQGKLTNYGDSYIFTVPERLSPDGKYYLHISITDIIIEEIKASSGISLSKMLSEYGMPKDILLYAKSSASMLPYASYMLVLYYPDQGIFAIYDGETQHGRRLQICQREFIKSNPYLILWSPDKMKTFDELSREIGMPSDGYHVFYPIEDISGISREEFYTTYADPANADVCFEIPDPDTLPTPTATNTSP